MGGTGILPESEGPRGAAVSGEGGAGFESLLQEPQAGARGQLTSAPLRASRHQSRPRCCTLACREGPSSRPGPPLSGLCSVQFWGGGGPHTAQTAPRPPQPQAPPPPWERLLLTPRGSSRPLTCRQPSQPGSLGPSRDPLFREPTPLSASSLRSDHCTGMRQEPLLRHPLRTPGTWIIFWHIAGAR